MVLSSAPLASNRAVPARSKDAVTVVKSKDAVAVKATKDAAAVRSRTGARAFRASANGPEALREKVRAEMRAEAAAAKQKAMVKVAEIEAKEEERESAAQERRLERQAAAQEYTRNLRQEEAEAEAETEAVTESAAVERPRAPSTSEAERVQQLLAERAARIRSDVEEVNALRQRVAARRLDPARFSAGAPARAQPPPAGDAPSTDAVIQRSLFQWAPPSETAPAPAPAASGASEAARAAWEWTRAPQQPPTLPDAGVPA